MTVLPWRGWALRTGFDAAPLIPAAGAIGHIVSRRSSRLRVPRRRSLYHSHRGADLALRPAGMMVDEMHERCAGPAREEEYLPARR